MTPDELHTKIVGLSSLPTLPSVVKHISRMVEEKHSNAASMGDIIAKDQVLSARILRLVNSPVYGFPGRISSITHALVLLGFNVVKGLVIGTSVFDSFGNHAVGLWEHSLGCAIVSRRLGRELNMSDAEEIMVAGLLHDLGKVVLSHVEPELFGRALEIAIERHCPIAEAERDVFGVDHACVAGWIAEEWHLPPRLSDALMYHHQPELAKHGRQVTAVVHLADILARGLEMGSPGDPTMPPLQHETFQGLGLSFEQIDRVLEQAELEYAAGAGLFDEQD